MLYITRTGRRLLTAVAATSLAATAIAAGASGAAAATVFTGDGVTTVTFQAGQGISLRVTPCPQAIGQLSADLVITMSQNGVTYTGPVHASAVFTSSTTWGCGGFVMVGSLSQASLQGSNAAGDTFSCDVSQGGYATLPLSQVIGWWGFYTGNCVVDGQSAGTLSNFEPEGFGGATGVSLAQDQATEVTMAVTALNYPTVP
jgi:hypothetical protein